MKKILLIPLALLFVHCNSSVRCNFQPGVAAVTEVNTLDKLAAPLGSTLVGERVEAYFKVQNWGKVKATDVSVTNTAALAPYRFLGGTYPGTGGTCGQTFEVCEPCTIVMEVTPIQSGINPKTLTFQHTDTQYGTRTSNIELNVEATYGQSGTLVKSLNLTGIVTTGIRP